MIRFTIHAVPVAQPRQRVGVLNGHARTYLPSNHPVNAFKAACSAAAAAVFPEGPMLGPINLSALFVMPRPKSMTRKKGPNPRYWSAKKPDVDNLMKSLQDALTGIVYADDAQIAAAVIRKTIAADCESPRVEVEVFALPSTTSAFQQQAKPEIVK